VARNEEIRRQPSKYFVGGKLFSFPPTREKQNIVSALLNGAKQPFKKEATRPEIVKELSLNKPTLLKVQITHTECLNPQCKTNSFPLSINGISKYQKATAWSRKR